MRFISPLLFFVANAAQLELAQQIQYLKAENEVLRARLPKHLKTTSQERAELLRFGKPVGPAIRGLIAIVHPATFMRWVREADKQKDMVKPRRKRRTPEEIAALVVRIATEVGASLGCRRILGELRKLGIRKISRGTVQNILRDHGVEPAPFRPSRGLRFFSV